MKDYREMYMRGILELSEEHGLAYTREQLDPLSEEELIALRDRLRMKYEHMNFKRYC